MERTTLTFLLAAALLAGCASAGPPVEPQKVAEAEAAIEAAEEAGAAEYAPELLRLAREAYLGAENSNNEFARQHLAEAEAYAEAARAKARAERLKADAARMAQEADDLEARATRFREQARPPL